MLDAGASDSSPDVQRSRARNDRPMSLAGASFVECATKDLSVDPRRDSSRDAQPDALLRNKPRNSFAVNNAVLDEIRRLAVGHRLFLVSSGRRHAGARLRVTSDGGAVLGLCENVRCGDRFAVIWGS